MKKYCYIIVTSLLLFSACIATDHEGIYSFIVNNSSPETITLKFLDSLDFNSMEVILFPTEEKVVRIFITDLGVYPYDLIKTRFNENFSELVFDTYIKEDKLDKEFWQSDNWRYYRKSDWEAEYKMTITKEMLEE